ncbi:DNA repair protein RecO [Phnomibacter ginsenosidimutans]|uniref:DNA repair protein RecO n=1 Tax=Phnomibacter ginsenosidimutans TaxID=2676868 RepID=A0A6I6GM73_9BACT|nr:DNA repair protein RecO [Phnomibacter ginsenosidimutans]QGW29595.1 DNA repair protein RecO [Phnomibacter ginsenosidimutans]
MLQTTKAIILRTTAYGDTSLIVSAYTERYGLQQYMVKGARKSSKKGSSMSTMLQPAAIVELVVYHNELKQLQLVKELKWAVVYQQVMHSIHRNAVALYMIELLTKTLRQPETNEELYAFIEDSLCLLDQCDAAVVANLPLFFSLKLAAMLGFRIDDDKPDGICFLDLQAGSFDTEPPIHGMYLDAALSQVAFELMQQDNAVTLYRIKLNQQQRRELLQGFIHFFQYHVADFGRLKTVQVLQEVLG